MITLCPTDPEFTPAGILKSDFFEDTIGMDHIPLNLRRNATKTWFKGYHSLFALIYDMFAVLQDPANPHALPAYVSTEHPAVGYTLPNPATLLEFARTLTASRVHRTARLAGQRTHRPRRSRGQVQKFTDVNWGLTRRTKIGLGVVGSPVERCITRLYIN